jgi:hypothetical protein
MKNESSSYVRTEAAETPQLRHWWVNHPHSDRAEVDGGYLWLPRKNKNGSRNQSHQNMTRLTPGDIVFSCAGATIAAIGFALERARSVPMPVQSGVPAQPGPADDGWMVPIRFVELVEPLRPKDHLAEIKPLLPRRQSPLRASGELNQNVYLAEIPAPMAQLLRRLLNRQVEDCEARIGMEMDGKLAEKAIEEHIWQRSDIGPRERRQLINARNGQGIFRERVEHAETACRVTGVLDRRYLRIASGVRHRGCRIRHAHAESRRRGNLWRLVRSLPNRMDRVRCDPAVSRYPRNREIRDHQEFAREPDQ